MSRAVRLVRAVTLGYGYQLTVMAVGLWLTPFYLRCIGGEDYGRWLIVGQLLGLLGLLDMGVTLILPREIGTAAGGVDPAASVQKVASRASWLIWLQTPLAAIVSLAVWGGITAARPDLAGPLGMVLITFTGIFPLRVFGAILVGLQDLTFGVWIQASAWALTTALTLALAIAGFGLYAMAAGWACGQVASAAVAYCRIRSCHPNARVWSGWPGWTALKAQIRPSLWASGYQFASALITGTDLLILGWVVGAKAVVDYTCTVKLPTVAFSPLCAIVLTSFPALSELRGRGDMNRFWQASRAVGAAMLLASGASAVFFLAAAKPFVGIWVGADRFSGQMVSVLAIVVMLARHFVLSLSGPAYVLGRERRLTAMVLLEGVVVFISTIGWTIAVGVPGLPLGALTGIMLVSGPIVVRTIAEENGYSIRQILCESRPWAVRLGIVFGLEVIAIQVVSDMTIWMSGGLALVSLVVYATAVSPLLRRAPLHVYATRFPNPLRRMLRLHIPTVRTVAPD